MKYLLLPPSLDHEPRPATAAAIITIYCILLLLLSASYFRLLYVVITNPGYVPRGLQYRGQDPRNSQTRNTRSHKEQYRDNGSREKTTAEPPSTQYVDGIPTSNQANDIPAPGSTNISKFMDKEIYTCEGDGKPVWCSTCLNYKPDRAHHCREVGRCVYKMDHFCPWVGGVVSDTSFKFFTQFVFFATFFSLFNMIHMAIWTSELRSRTGQLNVHWVITLAFGALFGLFTSGMALSSVQFILLNITTIENLTQHTKVWQFAVRIARPRDIPSNPQFNTATFSAFGEPESSGTQAGGNTYAILHTRRGENPYDLGYYENWKSVMGEQWWEWLLPITHSPCARRSNSDSFYRMGDAVQRMQANVGLMPLDASSTSQKRHPRKKRRRQNIKATETEQENKEEPQVNI